MPWLTEYRVDNGSWVTATEGDEARCRERFTDLEGKARAYSQQRYDLRLWSQDRLQLHVFWNGRRRQELCS